MYEGLKPDAWVTIDIQKQQETCRKQFDVPERHLLVSAVSACFSRRRQNRGGE